VGQPRGRREFMNPQERQLIEELKSRLKGKLPRTFVDAYLERGGADSIISRALELLERLIEKHETH
jgi:hypothetical protein